MKKVLLPAALMAAISSLSVAHAVSFGFTRLTSNPNPNIASQLSVDVTVSGPSVSFQFFNNVGISSSIAEIYFDDGMLGSPTITDSDGAGNAVRYVLGASPSNLPGGNLASPPFVSDIIFNSEADNPASSRGVSASNEWVKLTFGLGSFADLNAVLAAMANGNLRIGLHMISIAGGDSDSYISKRLPEPIPSPDGGSTLALLGLGMAGMASLAYRKK